MKVKILQENLNRGLGLVSRIVPSHPTLPVLGNVLLQAKDGKLYLSATNLEVGMVLKLKAKVTEIGEISVPARLFAEFIASLPPSEIELDLQGKTLEINTQTHHSRLNGIEANEFPPLPQIEGKVFLQVENKLFDTSSTQVVFAASTDEGRPVLSGVLMSQAHGQLFLAATDGFRLSHKTMAQSDKTEKETEIKYIIPSRCLSEVVRVLKEKELMEDQPTVEMGLTKEQNQIIFRLPNAEISSRLLEGQYPDFQKIIPKDFSTRAILEKDDLIKAVKLTSIFARDNANIIHFSFNPKEKKVTLDAQTKELGQSSTELEGSLEGDPLDIAFNSRFILDVLGALEGSQVSLEFSGALSPTQIKAVGDNSFFHILMPIRTEMNS